MLLVVSQHLPHLSQGKTQRRPVVSSCSATCSQCHPGAAPLLSWPTSISRTWAAGAARTHADACLLAHACSERRCTAVVARLLLLLLLHQSQLLLQGLSVRSRCT